MDIYNDDVLGRDEISSIKINLKKHVFGKDRYEQWMKIHDYFRFRSSGEIHLLLEHFS